MRDRGTWKRTIGETKTPGSACGSRGYSASAKRLLQTAARREESRRPGHQVQRTSHPQRKQRIPLQHPCAWGPGNPWQNPVRVEWLWALGEKHRFVKCPSGRVQTWSGLSKCCRSSRKKGPGRSEDSIYYFRWTLVERRRKTTLPYASGLQASQGPRERQKR